MTPVYESFVREPFETLYSSESQAREFEGVVVLQYRVRVRDGDRLKEGMGLKDEG